MIVRYLNTAMNEASPNRAKQRVRGVNGPDRKELPPFHQLGTITSSQLVIIRKTVASLLTGTNDIHDSEDYRIAKNCQLRQYFPQSYQQILLQIPEYSSEAMDESDYGIYKHNELEGFISSFAPKHFRARIAYLPQGEILDWHIDTNTSYACRVFMILDGEQKFVVKKRGIIYDQTMKAGDVWFGNTGYSHRVEVLGPEPRIAILFSCYYSSIEHLMPCLD
jgi:hypothetical protein